MIVNGISPPIAHKNAAIVARTYLQSLKPFKSTKPLSEILRERGNRVRMVKHAIVKHPRQRKATALTAHGKPILTISRCSMMGMNTPPIELPDAMTPIAYARFLLNQCPATDIVGLNLQPED